MKILVTGSVGFIGYHLSKSLLDDGYKVMGIDNINDYYDVSLKYGRLEELGINKSNIGPLAKCSFEETTVIMMNAAVFGEFDGLKGVSSNIMLGQIPPCGTGDSDIILDEMKLVETEKIEETKAEHLEDLLDISEYCDTNANFGFNISNIETDNVDLADMPVVEVH